MSFAILLGIGLVAGVFSGLFGIGGGLIIVPALMFFLGMVPTNAIATSLAALIPPVGLLGAIEYYRGGFVNVRYAALIAAGIFIGAYFGARITIGLDPTAVKRIYAAFLIVIGARMLFLGK
jgi:uncharacterized protein